VIGIAAKSGFVTDNAAPTLAGEHVVEFSDAKGERLLEVLGERALAGAGWQNHSHGAFLAVESPYPRLFDRLVVVLPRPVDRTPEAFGDWAQQRLSRLDRYMEATNTGKLVRTLPLEQSVAAVLMRRRGRDPSEPGDEQPPVVAIPGLLARFATDVDRYVQLMGDADLKYVHALRLHQIDVKEKPTEWLLGLDALNTVVGLRQPPLELTPLDLVRGILAEIGEQVDQRMAERNATRTPRRPVRYLAAAHWDRQARAVLLGLDDVLGWIDTSAPAVQVVAERLARIRPPRFTAVVVVPLALLAGAAVAGLFAAL